MNYSNTSLRESELFQLEFSPDAPVLQAILITLFAAATLVCNFVLILAVVRTTYLHTKTNVLLVSVAVSEILLGLFVMPFIAVTLFKPTMRFSDRVCDLVAFMTSLSRSSKALSMLSVSIDRCIAISHPLQYSGWMTKTTTVVLIVIVWSVGILFAVLPFFNIGKHDFLVLHGRCMVNFYVSPVFAITKELVCMITPSVAILVMFIIVITEARSHHRVTTIAQLAIAMYSGPASGVRGISYARSTFRALRTYIILSCIYLATCFPQSVYIVSVSGTTRYSNAIFVFVNFLTYFCSVSTPLIITTLNIKFRQAIPTLCVRRNKIQPVNEHEPYTISTGLQTILEHSMVFPHVPSIRDQRRSRGASRDEVLPGPSRQVPLVKFTPRRVSVLQEMQSSSSSDLTIHMATSKPQHAVLRKSLSSPT